MFTKYMKALKAGFDAFCADVKTDVVSVLSVCFIIYSMFKKEECSIFDYLDISFVIAMFNSDD